MSVEQAAERLRTYIGYDQIVRACSDYEPDEDCVKLADEYLRLFDQTPLSEEILRASGWYLSDDNTWTIDAIGGYLTSAINGGWCLFVEVYEIGLLQTVGDLRRLLSALHIDCEVVVPESEANE